MGGPLIAKESLFRKLAAAGWIDRSQAAVQLTKAGREQAAQLVRSHRLWESYLIECADYKSDHVHDEADRAEHWISPPDLVLLEKKLGRSRKDPHGSFIPNGSKEVAE